MRTSKADRLSDPDAHVKLKQLYEELCPEGMSQERFGAVSGIGSQGMVWQFLNGHTPLTLEAAARFAVTLGCTLYDISPMLDAAVRSDILPVLSLRKRLRRAAVVMLCASLLIPLHEATSHNQEARAFYSLSHSPDYTIYDVLRMLLRTIAGLFGMRQISPMSGRRKLCDGPGGRYPIACCLHP